MRKSIPNRLLGALLALFLAACGGTPPPPSSITLTVEDPMGSFVAAAYQVGAGSWTAINSADWTISGSTRTFTFPLNNQTKYGVAVRCSSSAVSAVEVIQATNSELANPKIECSRPRPSPVPFTVDVSINGITLASGDKVCVNGNSLDCQPAGANVSITLDLEPGTRDLLVTLEDSLGLLVKVAKVVRNVNVTNGGSTQVSLESGDQLDPVSFTMPPAPSGYTVDALVGYLSANNTASDILNASPTSYRPVSGFGSGDRYFAWIRAHSPNFYSPNATLISTQAFNSGAPSLAFPDPWTPGSITVQQTAHPTIGGLSRTENDLQGYQIDLMVYGQPGHTTTTILSKGWLGNATSYSVPDLSSQLGYTTPTSGRSGSLRVGALLSKKAIIGLNLNNNNLYSLLTSLVAGDYVKIALARSSFSVGGPDRNLP